MTTGIFMKRVMVFGTFDIFHPGHLSFLRQAKKFGEQLIVVVARDKNVLKIKGRQPVNSESSRLNQLKVVNIIDKVFLGNLENPYKIIDEIKPEVICLGYDQEVYTEELAKRFSKIKIYRLKAFKEDKYKSSKLTSKMMPS